MNVYGPARGTVEDYIFIKFMGNIEYHPRADDVYLTFGGYRLGSTKHVHRSSKAGNDACRRHQLNLHTPLPAQKMILHVSYNKAQLTKRMPVSYGS